MARAGDDDFSGIRGGARGLVFCEAGSITLEAEGTFGLLDSRFGFGAGNVGTGGEMMVGLRGGEGVAEGFDMGVIRVLA